MSFYSSFKLAVTMRDTVNYEVLSRAVETAMLRYPYFSVSPKREGESIVLAFNSRPVPVFDSDYCAVLGSEECNRHLLHFACEKNKIFLNASHYIADGMGIDPLLKMVLYLYVVEIYGKEGLYPERICMPGDPVAEEEYAYPFPSAPFETENEWIERKIPEKVHGLNPDKFDKDGLYAYHLHIP